MESVGGDGGGVEVRSGVPSFVLGVVVLATLYIWLYFDSRFDINNIFRGLHIGSSGWFRGSASGPDDGDDVINRAHISRRTRTSFFFLSFGFLSVRETLRGGGRERQRERGRESKTRRRSTGRCRTRTAPNRSPSPPPRALHSTA